MRKKQKGAIATGVKSAGVPSGGLSVQALGQSGFLFRDSAGLVICIDPCLADPVAKLDSEWNRLYPPPVLPKDLRCDVLILTHDHLDHLDPDTIAGLATDAVGRFVGPGNVCRHLRKLGVQESRVIRLDASQTVELGTLRITGTLAITNDAMQPDAEGIVLRFGDAPSVYHTGDTAFSPLLAAVKREKPDIYLPCINGRYGNMTVLEAAFLGGVLRARWAVPHHYDMFRHNLADPKGFVAAMREFSPETECCVLEPGEVRRFIR